MGVKNKKKIGMRFRIFRMMFLFLAVVFLLVFLSFNFLMQSYINSSAEQQISSFINHYLDEKGNQPPDSSKQPKNKMGIKAQTFTISSSYDVLETKQDNAEASAVIAAYLKDREIPLAGIDNMQLQSQDRVFHVSSVKDKQMEGEYLIFFTEVTNMRNFSNEVNFILIMVVIVTAVLSFVIAAALTQSITKPIKQIANSAMLMGKPEFTIDSDKFRDRELVDLSESLQQSAKQLAQYDNEQKTFFQNVSHELRTPLMAIKLNAEGIQYGLMDKQKSSGIIIAEVDRLSEMVEDLLYVSRMDTNNSTVLMHEVDIRDVLSLCAEAQKSMADKKKLSISVNFPDKPVLVYCSDKHLYRAFYNLVANAIQYAETKVAVSCETNGKKARITVTDDGPGIAPDDLPHIFERFYKGENGKHGIGLSIVKSAVDIHHGSVEIKQEEGTQFIIEIPLKQINDFSA